MVNELRFKTLPLESEMSLEVQEVMEAVYSTDCYVVGGFARYLAFNDLETHDIDIVSQHGNSGDIIRLQHKLMGMDYKFLHVSYNAISLVNDNPYLYPKVQILLKRSGMVGDVLNEFALQNEMFALIGNTNTLLRKFRVYATQEAKQATENREIKMNPLSNNLESVGRVAKYARKTKRVLFHEDKKRPLLNEYVDVPVYTVPNDTRANCVNIIANEVEVDNEQAEKLFHDLLIGDYTDACNALGIAPSY